MNSLQKTIQKLLEFGANLTREEVDSLLNEDNSFKSDISHTESLVCNRTGLSKELVFHFLASYITINNLNNQLNQEPQEPNEPNLNFLLNYLN